MSESSLSDELQRRRKVAEQQAEQRIAGVCDRLRQQGVEQVIVVYDGYGDEGVIEDVKARAADQDVELSVEDHEALSDAAYKLLPEGWDISEGSRGELVIDVVSRKMTREHYWRIESTDYEEDEFDLCAGF